MGGPNEGTSLVGQKGGERSVRMWIVGCAVVLCVDLNFALVSSFLPQEAESRGVSGTWVGVIIASMSAGNVLAATVSARAVDNWGAGTVLQVALLVYATLLVLMVVPANQFTAAGFITTCVPLRLLQGATSSFAEVSATVLVIRSVPVEQIARAMGWLEGARALGQLLGPVVGGGLYQVMHADESRGFWLPFVACASLLLMTVGLNWLLLPSSMRLVSDRPAGRSVGLLTVMSIFPAGVALLGQFMYVMSVTALEPILAPYLSAEPFGLQPAQLGLVSAANTLCFIVFVGLGSFIVGIIGPLRQAFVGQFTIAVGLFLMGPAPYWSALSQSLGLTWSGLAIAACGNALAIVTSAALIASALQGRGVPAEEATNAIAALLQQTAGVGAICGNLLGGTTGQHAGFRATTAGIGCAYLVLPLLFAYSHARDVLGIMGRDVETGPGGPIGDATHSRA